MSSNNHHSATTNNAIVYNHPPKIYNIDFFNTLEVAKYEYSYQVGDVRCNNAPGTSTDRCSTQSYIPYNSGVEFACPLC